MSLYRDRPDSFLVTLRNAVIDSLSSAKNCWRCTFEAWRNHQECWAKVQACDHNMESESSAGQGDVWLYRCGECGYFDWYKTGETPDARILIDRKTGL